MRFKIVVVLALLFINKGLLAQTGTEELIVQGITPNLYLVHTTKPKENMYSIGRLYNISPKDIVAFNKLVLEKPIDIGQVIKIPLIATNFQQNSNKSNEMVLVPIYHIVQDKEWLFKISINRNKVSTENLQAWNNIKNDGLKAGSKLVIGYLKVKSGQSVIADKIASDPPKNALETTPAQTEPTVKTAVPATDITIPKPEKPAEAIARKEDKTGVDKQQEIPPPVVETLKKEAEREEVKVSSNENAESNSGYFKTQYIKGRKEASGAAGIFKSVSGWSDGKYYALMNNVPIGTVVKVIAPATGKSIYAKVLGALPEMRESVGLTIRVSDSAASELGVEHSRFTVEVKY
jgi:LysM repeat protein